jgi:hypothetical protein
VVDSLPAALHGILAARLEPGLCLVQGAIGLLVAQGLLLKGGGREFLVPARLWGHDRPFLVNNMSKEGLKKEKKEEKEEKKEEKWLLNDETQTTEELGDPKALVEEVAVCSNAEELRSKGEPTSSNAQSEGNLEGSKTPQFRLDGCVDGLVCETVHDKDGPAIQVCKDDGFTSSQELPSPPEKESEDMADRVARLMKATKSDEEAPVLEYIWNKAVLRGLIPSLLNVLSL